MNKKQKSVLIISLIMIAASFIIWLAFGSEIFTKTQVLVETKDELFGWTEKKWENKFIWGLDLTLVVSGTVFLTGSLLMFLMRNKKKSAD
ncbi:MAG: hypothetical protein RDU14_17245 [Melioribacteraceae bacterium]|nr:hypothetical protein [Melioribacteraceae bacterium]